MQKKQNLMLFAKITVPFKACIFQLVIATNNSWSFSLVFRLNDWKWKKTPLETKKAKVQRR